MECFLGGINFLHFLFRKHLNRKIPGNKNQKNKILYRKDSCGFFRCMLPAAWFENYLHPTGPRGHDMTPTHSACAILRKIPQNYHQFALGMIPLQITGGIYMTPSLFQAFQQKMKNETRSLQHSCWCLIVYSLFGERKGRPKSLSFVKHGLSISADGTLALMEFCSKRMKNGKRVKTSELVYGNW